MQNNAVYLNGGYLPFDEAKESVLDQGFFFGDGVYEAIPVNSGHLFHFQEHRERLEHSLASVRLANPFKGNKILPGITRNVKVELAKKNIPRAEGIISLDAMATASGIGLPAQHGKLFRWWNSMVADGQPGPIFYAIGRLFQAYKQAMP